MAGQLIPDNEIVNPKQGNLLPHFILLPIQLLCLLLPPFKGRALLFVPIIAVIAYSTYTNHPGNAVADRAMAGVHWTVFVGTLEKLIFSRPESDFWRLTRGPKDAFSLWPFSFGKLKWALGLCLNLRGIGWNFQVKGVPKPDAPQKKWGFLRFQLVKYARCYLINDLVFVYFTKYHHEPGTRLSDLTLYSDNYARFFLNCFLAGCKLYFPLQMNYTLASILGVFSGLTEPKDWPPLFGDISKVTTIRYFWGTFWQQLLRRMFSGWGEGLVKFLNLPPLSKISTYFKLYVAFAISAFFHAIMTYTMPASVHHTFNDRFGLVFNGFLVQALSIHFEDIAIWAYRKVVGASSHEKSGDIKSKSSNPPTLWKTLLGWVWVTGWMWFSIYWAAEGYLKSGITLTSDVPVPFVEKSLDHLAQNKFYLEHLRSGFSPVIS